MKQLRLIKEDFDTLDVESKEFTDQYTNPMDCPAARALKRYFKVNYRPYVSSCSFETPNGKTVFTDSITCREIRRVAKKLSTGRYKSAVIKLRLWK